jgi:cyclopropane fatty-acyl-phospholipid synthase-like methyltransferase
MITGVISAGGGGTRNSDLVQLFTGRSGSYVRFIRTVLYPQGIRAYFLTTTSLKSASRILDAGCGTGIVMLALREVLLRRGLTPDTMQAFDLTPAMLGRFRHTLEARGIDGIELAQADVLDLAALPSAWKDYDLIVTASMLEYVPREKLGAALLGLRALLRSGGRLVLFMTRRNWLTRPLIGRWWQGHLYTADELKASLTEAGFGYVAFRSFPGFYRYLGLWGHVIEASIAAAHRETPDPSDPTA